ncbi:MAG TPA: agmatine deiminase [Steroidobacteraceae bacterium]|nr:agmatine deiminase [Steroidobacteraceae bacterium]
MTRTLVRTPRADGYWMPGEFESHAGTWMLWPERLDNWRDGARPAQGAFAAVAAAISRFEPVSVGVSAQQYEFARAQLEARVRVIEISNNDAWMRDVGPTFVVNAAGRRRAVDWQFNAWGGLNGGLYFPWDQDDLIARKVAEVEAVDRYRAPLVMEGGAIHSDGQGTLLVTEQCLLNANRNPQLSRGEIEEQLRAYTGATVIIWLGEGVINDETDGHVDNLACFARPGEVCLAVASNRRDPQWQVSQDALQRLAAARDARGRALKVHHLPMPGPLKMTAAEAADVQFRAGAKPRHAGERLAASYANFYIVNGGVIVPLLDSRTDAAAIAKLKRVFPEREVVGVPGREILLGGGNVHCITQQVPAAKARRAPR